MSQQISLWGATYSGVPAVTLPKTGGGTARFTDVTPTTATASDVATGKYFYAADGTLTLGTSSGTAGTPTNYIETGNGYAYVTPSVTNTAGYIAGGTITGSRSTIYPSDIVSGTLSITQNGTADVTNYASVDVNVSSAVEYTVTIVNTTGASIPRVQRNEAGTWYSADGDTFKFSEGDTLRFYCGTSDWFTDLYENGTITYSGHGYYTYTPPKCDIEITFSSNSAQESGYGNIVYSGSVAVEPLSITSNGTYTAPAGTAYSPVTVNVSGSGIGTLLNTTSMGTISTSSTTAADTGKSLSVSGVNNYDLLIVETSVDSVTNNRHTATVGLIFLTASSAVGTKNGANIATAKWNSRISSSAVTTTRVGTTAYGIYPNSCTVSNGTATIPMYQRYNSTSTGTINGAYTARVYGVKLYDLIGG